MYLAQLEISEGKYRGYLIRLKPSLKLQDVYPLSQSELDKIRAEIWHPAGPGFLVALSRLGTHLVIVVFSPEVRDHLNDGTWR